jgi:azurin
MRLLVALSLALFSASFSPAPAAMATDPRTVTIVGTDDMKYSVATITATRGETLTIQLVSKGKIPKVAMAHNVVVLKPGTDILKLLSEGAPHRATDFIAPSGVASVIARTVLAGPGETVQVTFKVPLKAGRYPFICTFAGHYQAGMKGTLIVK